ncbi:hypothetical protein KJ870_10870 [bacterium]|nr:hypothetical protein [bacterium]MBU1435431.1 hypothetical protein [bacterium]MBU1502645.1 hypothetical protein [bacterium]MBU3939906.1 hypothetical protein [bacterium]MBU4060046.1 hypothetical protein [bacterium]
MVILERQALQEKTQPMAPDCSLGILIREGMIPDELVFDHGDILRDYLTQKTH